jgi:hypothetical protein
MDYTLFSSVNTASAFFHVGHWSVPIDDMRRASLYFRRNTVYGMHKLPASLHGTAQIKDKSANKEKSRKKAQFLVGAMFSRKEFRNNNLESNLQPMVYEPQS